MQIVSGVRHMNNHYSLVASMLAFTNDGLALPSGARESGGGGTCRTLCVLLKVS